MKKLFSKYKYHLCCFVAGFIIALFLTSGKEELKTINTSYVEKTSSEYVKGKEDTTRKSISVSFKAKGTRNSEEEKKSGVASFDTVDAKTGFAASVKYDINKNVFDNSFIFPQLEIERTDTLKQKSSLVSARDAEVSSVTSSLDYARDEKWSLSFGIQHNFETGFIPHKYLTLRFEQKVILLNLICEAGFYNRINESLYNLKPLVKAELSLGL